MWDLPGPGLEPVSPALAGGFLTTAPPGKSQNVLSNKQTKPETHHVVVITKKPQYILLLEKEHSLLSVLGLLSNLLISNN